MTDLKQNQHYIPRFWLRHFANDSGQIYSWDGKKTRPASVRKVMAEDWLYTIYDAKWQASDLIEDGLCIKEGIAAPVFVKLGTSNAQLTDKEYNILCDFIALQACRHPDVLARAHRLGKEYGAILSVVHNFASENDFITAIAKFGIPEIDARANYHLLLAIDRTQLAAGFAYLNTLTPEDPSLPQQDALLAQSEIALAIKAMPITLLDAPTGINFIIGDTPLEQSDLGRGFTIPLTKNVAIIATSVTNSQPTITRRTATVDEVKAINQVQRNNALKIVIGPDPKLLKA